MASIDWDNFDRPKTIGQLRQFVLDHNLPYEKMRFFIGEDYRGAKAFGIYQDADGSFVVYKNKADGSRAVRYHGPDEAFAVGELYDRMCAEIKNQKAHNAAIKASSPEMQAPVQRSVGERIASGLKTALIALIVAGVTLGGAAVAILSPNRGYYIYDNGYYCYNDGWYQYNETLNSWHPAKNPGSLLNYRKHLERKLADDPALTASYRYENGYYGDGWEYRFEDTTYYDDWLREQEERESQSDDDDWDWDDDDDWDSDWTDWDSDW